MRCSQCGLPLSPSRISCPRCATLIGESETKTEIKDEAQLLRQGTISSARHEEDSHRQTQGEQSGEITLVQHYPPLESPQLQMYAQQATIQEEQRNRQAFPSTPMPLSSFPERLERTRANDATSGSQRPQEALGTPKKPKATAQASLLPGGLSRTRLGFTVAGVCMGTGAVILIFVFIMAQSLLAIDNAALQAANQRNQERATALARPTLPPAPSPTALNLTPMPDTPGSKYIDNIQIGTTINTNRVVITQETKNFQAGQRIYISMNVNSVGYQGAVCLDWYVQDVFVTHYAFPTTADPSLPHSTALSYATLLSKGAGYVDVSWASSIMCTDKVLAQRVDFNIGE